MAESDEEKRREALKRLRSSREAPEPTPGPLAGGQGGLRGRLGQGGGGLGGGGLRARLGQGGGGGGLGGGGGGLRARLGQGGGDGAAGGQGGGLGGGSSDAATTLVVLNALWHGGLSSDELAEIGMGLGADVPVFVRGFSGLGEGVGERLMPLELPDSWFLVIHPRVSIPTRDVFQAPELTRNSPVLTIPALLASGGRNDCEPVVRERYPEVAAALDWLGRYASARLTGTGSCLFARFASAAEAERVAARVPDVWRAYVVQGLAESPLLQVL